MSIFQIITSSMAVAGFVLSLINIIVTFITRHRNIAITMRNYTVRQHYNNTQLANVYLLIENRSQLSISITRIRLLLNNDKLDTSVVPQTITTETKLLKNTVVSRYETKSSTLPINLLPLGSFGGFLSFPIPQDSLSTTEIPLTFEISTNRGKSFQMTLKPSAKPPAY